MKKIFFTLLALLAAGSIYPASRADNIRIDINTMGYKPAELDWAAGGGLAFGYATRDIDFMLGGRYLQYDLGRTRTHDIMHAFGRADVKFHLPRNPLTLIAGMGLGFSSASVTYIENGTTSQPREKQTDGPVAELSFGVMFPMSQTISVVGRGILLYNVFKLDDVTSLSASGAGLELGVRFSFGPTRELDY